MSPSLLALALALSPALAWSADDAETPQGDATDEAADQEPADETPGAEAPADDEQPPGEEDAPPDETAVEIQGADGVPLLIDTSGAQELGDITPEQAEWLKPKLSLLPPNSRDQTDFTAYVLEWGELKLGLNTMQVGLLPGLQGGTSVPLLALQVPNANLKLDFVRAGPLDIAATGQWYSVPREGFEGRYLNAGGMLSLQILEAWSIHGGGGYAWIDTTGFPDVSQLSSWITGNSEIIDLQGELADASLAAELLTVRAATDIRFSRRDSIVLQFSSIPYAMVTTDPVPENLPPIFGLDQLLALNGPVPISQSYTASVAWQIQWKHAQLRLGVGHSSTPGAWLTQCLDFSYRFLGATRIREYRQRRTWRQNQEAAEKGTLDQQGQPEGGGQE
jgi:hypothetical protein